MRPLALHQLSALDASPLELVSLAAVNNLQGIVTWVHVPNDPFPGKGWGRRDRPSITRSSKAEIKRSLAENGIELTNLEMFPIADGIDVEAYRPYLELGGELNAARAVVHVHDLDENRAIDSLHCFCEMAAEYKLGAGIEFMGLTDACKTLERGLFFAKAVGLPNVGIAVDCLHVVRTGATVEDVRNAPAQYISYAQICDGRGLQVSDDYLAEGTDRLLPGEGDWPVRELIKAMPAATPIDIEVPLTTLKDRGMPVGQRVARAVKAARTIVESVTPER